MHIVRPKFHGETFACSIQIVKFENSFTFGSFMLCGMHSVFTQHTCQVIILKQIFPSRSVYEVYKTCKLQNPIKCMLFHLKIYMHILPMHSIWGLYGQQIHICGYSHNIITGWNLLSTQFSFYQTTCPQLFNDIIITPKLMGPLTPHVFRYCVILDASL